ncbi:MAG: oxygenase MpaB family protein [Polyangiaceae bacterium]
MAVAAFHALGVPADDPRITGALTWIHNTAQLHVDPDASQNLAFHGFRTGIWSTALLLRALFAAGVPRSDPRVVQALRWLMDSQIHEDLPALVPTAPGAPRSGGWAFECRNPTTPDADDTAVVLGAFGLALQGQGTDVLDEQTATLVRASVDKGLAFLLGMQNPDGGWPAFQQGLTSKPRGPFLVSYPVFERGNLLQDLETALRNTPVFGDPATEDITGRTLFALAQHGYTRDSPVVQKAIAFLIAQQCTQEDLGGGASHEGGGPWWSRWISNYLVATSYVLGGLAAVGVDPQEPFIRRAVDWTLRQQNEDGGWGEEAASYQNPALAGQGASMPVTTAVVICGLIQIGEGRSDAVKRAVNYLLRVPREPSGMWPDPGPLHVFARTDQFYKFTGARLYYPLEALARYRALLDGAEPAVAVADRSAATTSRADALGSAVVADRPVRDAKGGWDVAALESLRTSGDPEADAVVRAIFEDGHLPAVNALMARIARNDDPVPQGLPPIAADYFERTAKLPEWAEPDKLARASRVFSSVGWATAFALYYGSLPQCYAGAKGARALIGTRSFIDFPEQRILETAQFIFDVASDGAFAEGGSGIRAPQKVRLLHAAIRRLTLEQATWDMEWGIPVNQEDAAATLMSFAVVIIDVWKKMGFDFSDEDNEAWLHLWKVVGHYLGVHPDLLPRDLADARALWEAITGAQWAPSDSGRALTRSLFGLADRILPHYRGANLPPTLLRHFSGDRCADLLGAPPGDWTSVLLRGGAFVERLAGAPDHDSRVASLAHAVATDLMKGLVLLVRGGKQTRFRIPPALLHDWNMSD